MLAGLPITGAPAAPPPPWSAVLDCSRTVYAIDPLICGAPKLLAGARRVEEIYAAALAGMPDNDARALGQSQEAWSKQRNMCAFKRRADVCIDRLQKKRVREIERHGH